MPSADADEDAIHPPPTDPHDTSHHTNTNSDDDDDDDDAGPSLAFLTTLTTTTRSSSALPKRGLKDFAPNPTDLQASVLTASRDAMHSALCHTRTHIVKNHVVGIYDEETGLTRVRRPRGNLFTSIGRSEGGEGVVLEPEEALWALERGSLDVWWCCRGSEGEEVGVVGEEKEEEEDEDAIPLSLQAAYALYLGGPNTRNLTPERYQVYAHLRRSGFIVRRAEGFDGGQTLKAQSKRTTPPQTSVAHSSSAAGVLTWLISLLWSRDTGHERPPQGPLVRPGLYRSYVTRTKAEIYRQLQLHPSKPTPTPTPTSTSQTTSSSSSATTTTANPDVTTDVTTDITTDATTKATTPFTTHYHLHRPSPNFRKSSPGPPAFSLCVVNARDTPMPTLVQLSGLLEEQHYPLPPRHPHTHPPSTTSAASTTSTNTNPSPKAKNPTNLGATYKSLKTSGNSILLAIVDEGVISYLRFGEADFTGCSGVLWDSEGGRRGAAGGGGGRGGKGGRRGGGGGRGRGRGGGGGGGRGGAGGGGRGSGV
ncbi:MAG: tRNA-splicing endonuclease subunit sen54 [Chrysothrix sp. TS-e1954]|nr:MAG: tRNA-splicing endonuclease subunit sen54 [Chrysothrix sp. TS-e1954]